MSQPLQSSLASEPSGNGVTETSCTSASEFRKTDQLLNLTCQSAASHIVRRLSRETSPDPLLRIAVDHLVQGKPRLIAKRGDLFREGDRVEHLFIIIEGWACRYKSTSDGARQIIGFLIPGDICNPEHINGIRGHGDDQNVRSSYAVAAITQLTVVACRLGDAQRLIEREGRIAQLIWSDVTIMSDRERSWLLNIGQRDAMISVSHLLCELVERLDCVGMLRDGACLFPITQDDIGAATGLSSVHINRTFGELRRRGLISFKGRALAVIDRARLELFCLFEPLMPRMNPHREVETKV